MSKLNRDLHVSAELIAFIKAGFYGQVLFEAALARLSPDDSPLSPKYLETAHKALDRIDRWTKDLSEELPLIAMSWSTAETFDAIAAMGFVREFKRECLWMAPQIETALVSPNLPQNRDTVKLLAAGLLRSAATRACYVETLAQCFTELKAKDYAEGVAAELDGAKEYSTITNSIVDIFSGGTVYSNELCDKLRKEASLVPSDLRSYVHDANILLNILVREFSFELAEIPTDEARDWNAAQVPPTLAGYWRAYQFSPLECVEWANFGIRNAPLAANWRRARFYPDEASRWIREGIAPIVATEWRNAGFEAPRAGFLLRKGFTDPAKAPRHITEEDEQSQDDGGEDEWSTEAKRAGSKDDQSTEE